MTARCTWSDLHPWECAHCGPTPAPAPEEPEDIGPDLEIVPAAVTSIKPYLRPTRSPKNARSLPEDTTHYNLIDYIAALCDHTRNAEPRTVLHHNRDGSMTPIVTRHFTTHPPLIQQLWEAAEGSRGLDVGNKAFGSQPSARVEALDVANDIDREVHRILRHDHGLANSHDTYPETIAAVRHLGSIATNSDARTIRRWWATARVVTGWDLPAFKPDNTCPLCAKRGTLRIKYPTAFCTECRSHWDQDTIGLLVEHVRTENHEDDTPEITQAV